MSSTGTVSGEVVVNAPASEVWKVYGTLELAAIVEKGLTDILDNIEIEGDGSVGTVLKINFKPGVFPFAYSHERFIKVDNESRVKVTDLIEGGYLDLGFNYYRVCFEVIEKDEKSCITKATIEYDIKKDSAADASSVSIDPIIGMMSLAATHILAKST